MAGINSGAQGSFKVSKGVRKWAYYRTGRPT